MDAITRRQFRRSSFCGTGSCVEVAQIKDDWVALRDSSNPATPENRFTAEEWIAFVRGVKAGEFDYPAPNQIESETVRLTL